MTPSARRRPLRIAHVNDIAAVGSTLARAMCELGEDAALVEPWRLNVRLRYPLKLVALPARVGGVVAAGISLRLRRYDVIHVHYGRLGMLGPLSGKPFTLHLHGTDIRGVRPRTWWGREISPFIKRASLVYYSTPDLAEWVEPFRSEAIFLPNPIETDRFAPVSVAAESPDRDLLVGVRLSAVKGLDRILETLRLLAAERPSTSITIVAQGEGVEAARAAAGPDVTVVARATRDELPALIRTHRLALGQFQVGSIGNYELECLACGVPVIMRFDRSDAYGQAPPLVNANDPRDAVDGIVRLLDDRPALAGLSAEGPAWVKANHDARVVAARVLDDYRRTGQTPD